MRMSVQDSAAMHNTGSCSTPSNNHQHEGRQHIGVLWGNHRLCTGCVSVVLHCMLIVPAVIHCTARLQSVYCMVPDVTTDTQHLAASWHSSLHSVQTYSTQLSVELFLFAELFIAHKHKSDFCLEQLHSFYIIDFKSYKKCSTWRTLDLSLKSFVFNYWAITIQSNWLAC